MGEKISDYINSASSNPNTASLLDLSEFDGSSYESVKWQISDFLTWLQNNVTFSEVYTFYNNSGATIEKGTPVLIDSIQGGIVAINDYSIKPNNTTSKIFVAKEQILNGANGVFFQSGLIDNIDTSLYSVGATLYFNYTSGTITNVYGSDIIYLGIVITSAVSGSIFVAPEQAQNVVSNIYNDNGTLSGNRIMDGANNELLFQSMGKFSVHSHANNVDNIVFEVRSQAGFESFTIRDHNTGDHLFCIENGKVEINNEYFLPNVDGSANRVVKTDGAGQWGYGVIQDNGTTAGINSTPSNGVTFNIEDNAERVALRGFTDSIQSSPSTSSIGVNGVAFASQNSSNAFSNVGVQGVAGYHETENVGVFGSSTITSPTAKHIGVYGQALNGFTNYCFKGVDGTQAVGRFLKCLTIFGEANWSDIAISDVSNLQTEIDTKTDKLITENAQTGTSYTLVLSDADKLVTMNNASANTLTIPTNSVVAFPIGTQILISQSGAGVTTIQGDPGVTIQSFNSLVSTAGQYATVSLIKKGTDTWLLTGNLA
jgi:hypothetical protein